MEWDEEKQELMTCGKDKKIKVWQLPPLWMDEEDIKNKVQLEDEEIKASDDGMHKIDTSSQPVATSK